MPCRMSLLFEAEVNRIKQLYRERIIEIQTGLDFVLIIRIEKKKYQFKESNIYVLPQELLFHKLHVFTYF